MDSISMLDGSFRPSARWAEHYRASPETIEFAEGPSARAQIEALREWLVWLESQLRAYPRSDASQEVLRQAAVARSYASVLTAQLAARPDDDIERGGTAEAESLASGIGVERLRFFGIVDGPSAMDFLGRLRDKLREVERAAWAADDIALTLRSKGIAPSEIREFRRLAESLHTRATLVNVPGERRDTSEGTVEETLEFLIDSVSQPLDQLLTLRRLAVQIQQVLASEEPPRCAAAARQARTVRDGIDSLCARLQPVIAASWQPRRGATALLRFALPQRGPNGEPQWIERLKFVADRASIPPRQALEQLRTDVDALEQLARRQSWRAWFLDRLLQAGSRTLPLDDIAALGRGVRQLIERNEQAMAMRARGEVTGGRPRDPDRHARSARCGRAG